MTDIQFPNQQVKHHYYGKHADFIFKMAALVGKTSEYVGYTNQIWFSPANFSFLYKGKQILVNTGDLLLLDDLSPDILYFKYHYNESEHGHIKNVFPLGSMFISPAPLTTYQHFFGLIEEDGFYNSANNMILSKQRPFGQAVERRKIVQSILRIKYGNEFDCEVQKGDHIGHWKAQRNCLVNVCVPGARPDMVDRGHLESMGLGVCVVAPPITDVLAGFIQPVAGVHYVECKADYSNLVRVVEWCKDNRDRCQEIGDNCKELFRKYYTPENYWKWIDECMEKVYG
jgi:hypothetical protein